jgi:hypothetical protein
MNQKKIFKSLHFLYCQPMLQSEQGFYKQKHLINKKSCKTYFSNQAITNLVSNSNS